MSTSLRPRCDVALPLAAAVVAFCLGVAAPAQEPPATPATPAVPSATPSQDERPAARTFRTTLTGAVGLDVETVQGAITVRRDPAAAGLEVTALLRRAEGVGGRRFSDAEFDACVRGAKLAADKDAKGNVVARLVFPDAPTTDKDEARRYTERRDSSCEVEFVVRTDGLAGVVANNVTGDLRVEGDVGKASLTTISGDVFVRGTTGAVTAESVSGDIDLRAVAAAVAASSISGDIRVDLADAAKEPIDVDSTSGSIELTLSPAWQGTWRASSTMGAVTVDGRSARTGRRAQAGVGTDAKGTIGDADAARAKLATVTGAIRLTGAGNRGQDAKPAPTPAAESEPAPRRRVVRIGGLRSSGDAEGEAAATPRRGEAATDEVDGGHAAAVREAVEAARSAAAAAQEQARAAIDDAMAELAEHGILRDGAVVAGDMMMTDEVEDALRSAAAAVRDAMRALGGKRRAAGNSVAYRSLSIRRGDDGAVRVEVEQLGDDGKVEKKVYEAPDMATFQRQHPGVLDDAVVSDDEQPRRATPRARANRPAK
jgi:hypothetical protein